MIPLSFGQERLWYHEQTLGGSPVYNMAFSYELTGKLDLKILEESLKVIIKRHDILRTYFVKAEGKPVQAVRPEIDFFLDITNLQELPIKEKEKRAYELALEESETPFNLTKAPLWRFKLLQLDSEKSVLLVTIHHIICDHWSLSILMQELATIYQDIAAGQNVSLPPLARQYGEFTLWQNQWLEGKKNQKQLAYWEEKLGGKVSPLVLPFDQPPSPLANYQGKRQLIVLSKELTSQLKALSEEAGVTLFMTLLTGFKSVLYQYTRQEDMIVCSPIAGRHRRETKGLMGYFNNIIPLRTDLSGDPSFSGLLKRVSQTALKGYQNMDLPFQKIANLPNLKRVPLTRAMFALQHSPSDEIQLSNLTIGYPNFQHVHNGTANFELSLFLEEREGSVTGVLDYKTALFEPTTIEEMVDNFVSLLESSVTNPERKLSSLPILRDIQPREQTQVTITDTPYVAPEKEVEQKIAQVWQEVLQVEKISLHHNFFELGGNSLAIAQVTTQLQEIFKQEISIVDLFSYPTVKTLAQYLSQEEEPCNTQFKIIQNNVNQQKQARQRRKQLMKQRRNNHG